MDKKESYGRILRLGLMISSVALLMLLQGLWLVNLYEQSVMGFRRESSALFNTAMFSLRDSLFHVEIDHAVPVSEDSLKRFLQTDIIKRAPGVAIVRRDRDRQTIAWQDSGLVKEFRTEPDEDLAMQKFVLRIRGDDTLSIELLQTRYSRLLQRAGYSYPFIVYHSRMPDQHLPGNRPFDLRRIISDEKMLNQTVFNDTLATETFPLGPVHAYAAIFPDMRSKFIGKISGQILFSGFLTLITIAAFIVLYKSLRTQERLIEMKNDFIGNVTHELKTPIATVSVAIEALKDFHALKDPARTGEYLSIAQHELNRLSLMTDKILKTSVFEQQGVTFIPGVVRLDDLVKQVLRSLTVVLEKKRMATSLEFKGHDFNMQGSDMHLTNVVYNLLDNAIKYSPENTSITVELEAFDSEIVLLVRDQGMGIDPVHHKRIFEKFFRVPTGDVHNTRGYGLGLNYVADVVRSHNGTVTLESATAQGSCFILRFPRAHVS